MRVNHPRFINIADQEVIKQEFPTFLEKQADSQNLTYLDTPKYTNSVFVFPEVIELHHYFSFAISSIFIVFRFHTSTLFFAD